MMNKILSVFLVATLVGCSVGSKYKAPTSEQLGIPFKWNTAAPECAATGNLSEWWKQLNDTVLSSLIDQALKGSLDLRSAQARLREARARRGVAGSQFFPTITASGSAQRNQRSGNASATSYSAGFDASWEADIFGRIRSGVKAAQADLEATEADLYNTQISLIAEVAVNYIDVRAFQSRIKIARANLANQSETLQLTEWRAEAGLTSSVDVEQARANRNQTQAQIPSLETGLAEAQHRIAILLGQTPGSISEAQSTGDFPAVPDEIILSIPSKALAQRPDVRAAERRLVAETARIGQAEAARYPGLNLGASIGISLLTGNPVELIGSLIGSVFQTIFDAGKLRQQVEIQNAIQQQALMSYESTVLDALEEVENALVSLAKNRERLQSLQEAAAAARNAALLAREQYTSGLIDFQRVLDSERTVLNIEDSLSATQADEISALIRLYKALGGGWSPAHDTKLIAEVKKS